MPWMSKEPVIYPPMKIYRGKDPELIEKPILKTEDYFEKVGGFGDRMMWAVKRGLQFGLTFSVWDIWGFSRITDRRAQIARTAFFTIPALSATVGWMAMLEISKKSFGREMYQEAYVAAATVPAAVYCVWRRRLAAFPKIFIPIALMGAAYQKSVDENLYLGFNSRYQNPNEPYDHMNRPMSLFGESRRWDMMHPKQFRGSIFQPADPGPTYAKWE